MSWRIEGEAIPNDRKIFKTKKRAQKMCPRMELIETCPNQSAFRAKNGQYYLLFKSIGISTYALSSS